MTSSVRKNVEKLIRFTKDVRKAYRPYGMILKNTIMDGLAYCDQNKNQAELSLVLIHFHNSGYQVSFLLLAITVH
jgi:hypothetical protein